jgi:hypothetical protein
MIRGCVSVLIACYQHGHWLGGALESVFAQTHPDMEAVVADDGSTDRTPAVAAEWERRRPGRVTLIGTPRLGQAGARRAALERATGEFYITLDADDLLEPRMAARCLAALARDPGAAAAAADVWMVDESATRALRRLGQGRLPGWPGVLEGNPLGGVAGVMVRVEQAGRIGGLAPAGMSGAEDWDFSVRLVRAGLRVAAVPEALARYRQSGGSHSRNPVPVLQTSLDLLERCRTPDARLELPPERQPVLADGEWKRLRNRQVFFVAGLAAAGVPSALPEVLACRVKGGGDPSAWARAFAAGVNHAILGGGSGAGAAARIRVPLAEALQASGEGDGVAPLQQELEQAVRRLGFKGPRYWLRRIEAWRATRRFRAGGGVPA